MVLINTFFGSLIIMILGVIGRYLANIYTEVRGRPLYLIDETYNLDAHHHVEHTDAPAHH
jgi:dolichol-phosphate mannosyltransferase